MGYKYNQSSFLFLPKTTSDFAKNSSFSTVQIVAETVTEVGDPKVVICEAVEKHNIQLLVLGSHGRGGIQRYVRSYSVWCVDGLKRSAKIAF